MSNYSAPGPSGFRPGVPLWLPSRCAPLASVPVCRSLNRANNIFFSLTSLVDLFASSRAPPFILMYFCEDTLIPIWKKSGGLCPIAIGQSLQCLSSNCLAFSAQSRFLPNQLGVDIKGGCEAIIHSVSSRFFHAPPVDNCQTLLPFSNAFISIDKRSMFHEFSNHIQSFSLWVEVCYFLEVQPPDGKLICPQLL